MSDNELAAYLMGVYHTTLAHADRSQNAELRLTLRRLAMNAAHGYTQVTGQYPRWRKLE